MQNLLEPAYVPLPETGDRIFIRVVPADSFSVGAEPDVASAILKDVRDFVRRYVRCASAPQE